MRTLITGITGFVGHHIAPALLARGDEILGLGYDPDGDDPGAGLPDGVARESLDLLDVPSLIRRMADFRPDRVLHLAAQSDTGGSIRNPGPTIRINVEGTLGILEAIRRSAPAARLLFVSSSEVYGNPGEILLDEAAPIAPVNPYGASKAAGELLVAQYGRCWGLDRVVARSFPHAGPGQRPAFALPSFARQIARIEAGLQEPRLSVGNLEAQRDILDVEDVVAAYLLLLESGTAGETYNVCSGEVHSIREGLDALLAMSEREIEVVTDSDLLRPLDQPILRGRCDKLNAETGWRPRRSYGEILERILDDWRRRTGEEAE